MMWADYYYDLTPDRRHTSDTEGNLVQLCPACGGQLRRRGEVALASRGDDESSCERCDGRPASAHTFELFDSETGRVTAHTVTVSVAERGHMLRTSTDLEGALITIERNPAHRDRLCLVAVGFAATVDRFDWAVLAPSLSLAPDAA